MTDDVLTAAAERLAAEIAAAPDLASALPDDTLRHLAAAIRDEVRDRARRSGDHDAIIDEAFEQAFGRDGLGSGPWVSGDVIVCPGSIVAKNRSSHRCRFVSVDDVWIWDSHELIREEKQSHPGRDEGFKAVALLPVIEGMELDVVTGRARAGQHSVERVVSYEIRRGELVEVSQRTVNARDMH
ncbi:MAG: hypothetical protein AAGA90_00130 [Actinomycetota bacterium]